jgi:hypothetical protein
MMSGTMNETGDLEGPFFPERKKNSVWVATMAEIERDNGHGTYLIAIPASQTGHTRSESFGPSRYASRLLKEGYDDMYGLYMSKRTVDCSLGSS